MLLFLSILLLGGGAYAAFLWSASQRRQMLLSSKLSDEKRSLVAKAVPLTGILPEEVRSAFEGKISLFIDQVEFIGCNGLTVTDYMRYSIAAQACLLVANKDTWFENLRTVLIYPSAFKSRVTEYKGYVVTERETVRIGESWARGPVILSWEHSDSGAADISDGHNVVFHEFAHQLDDLSGETDGVPVLEDHAAYVEWAIAFQDGYDRHQAATKTGSETLLDSYGATSMEEFFAVAVESFFERPKELLKLEPDIYAQLMRYFKLDPANWN